MKEPLLIFFDTETTGCSKFDRIIEFGAVKTTISGKNISTFSELANPGFLIPENITRLTGITNKMVKDKDNTLVVTKRFLNWCNEETENIYFIAHNVQFDIGMTFRPLLEEHYFFPGTYRAMDTLDMSKKFIKDSINHKLGTLSEHIGYSLKNAHRALNDAYACLMIFSYLMRTYYKPTNKDHFLIIADNISKNVVSYFNEVKGHGTR